MDEIYFIKEGEVLLQKSLIIHANIPQLEPNAPKIFPGTYSK